MNERLLSYTITRRYDASPARLFRALTDPVDLAAWAWGDLAKDVRATASPVAGGTYEVSRDEGGKRQGWRGIFVEVVPGRRVVQTVHWDSNVGYNGPGTDPVDEIVAMEIEPSGDGATLSYTHRGIPDVGNAAKEHEGGVRATLETLARRLASAP